MEITVLIAILTALAAVIGWVVIVQQRNKTTVDAEISALKVIFERKATEFSIQDQEHTRRHNNMVLDVATMQRDLSDKIERQNVINMSVQQILHDLRITLTKLDTTLGHLNKMMDGLVTELKDQKEIIDELRFKR